MKNFFANIGYKIKMFLYKIQQRSYGMDDLNKTLVFISIGISVLQMFLRNQYLYILSSIVYFIFIFRFFSTKKFKRAEENRKFRKATKSIRMKWKYRKTHKVFKCSKCGQFIKVPKGQGQIEVTCPSCGNKEMHRS